MLLVLLTDHTNTLRMEQNGRYFADVLNFIFLNENCCNFIDIQGTTGSDNGLLPIGQQGITSTCDGLIYWCILARFI